ncbi:MAG: hypothetical protein [Bacteroides phage LoVEphage]|nr:MAG: hypothetical protein [Bacteroides phage LoVEphage]
MVIAQGFHLFPFRTERFITNSYFFHFIRSL